jgi:hypothetical protein
MIEKEMETVRCSDAVSGKCVGIGYDLLKNKPDSKDV